MQTKPDKVVNRLVIFVTKGVAFVRPLFIAALIRDGYFIMVEYPLEQGSMPWAGFHARIYIACSPCITVHTE